MSFVKLALFVSAIAVQSNGSVNVPDPPDLLPIRECGTATVYGYGTKWHGDTTATGETFRPRQESTCAHRTLPFGTIVTLVHDGQRARCRINDRGPYIASVNGRRVFRPPGTIGPNEQWDGIVDLSIKAAQRVGLDGKGRVCLAYDLSE